MMVEYENITLNILNKGTSSYNEHILDQIVDIHMKTFTGFFLTFLGKGFLKQLYRGFYYHEQSGIIVAELGDSVVGFLAYSKNMSSLYKYLITKGFISFAWYSISAAIRKPSITIRLIKALFKPIDSISREKYIELSSIGVIPQMKGHHIGHKLIEKLKENFINAEYTYIKLETDAEDNDSVNAFYVKNGFSIDHEYTTPEGRKMYEYRWSG